ncbi:MAG: ATP-binding protein [Desulfovermiculus sp.]
MFRKAEKRKARLRMALIGPSGSGKTYSSLLIAKGLGGSIAMIDTEQGSGELYADLGDYDVARMTPPFSPMKYIQAIKEAEKAGYSVLIIDSLTHAWAGQGGLLEEVDKRKAVQKNQFAAWRDVTPMHNALVDAMLQSSCHIIATMRSKTAYEMQKDEKGQLRPVKIGLAPVQRDGMEYEFTLVMDIENEKHMTNASKDRTRLFDGQYFVITEETGKALQKWLETGKKAQAPSREKSEQVQEGPRRATDSQIKNIEKLSEKLGVKNAEERVERINKWLRHHKKATIEKTEELSFTDATDLIGTLLAKTAQTTQEEAPV